MRAVLLLWMLQCLTVTNALNSSTATAEGYDGTPATPRQTATWVPHTPWLVGEVIPPLSALDSEFEATGLPFFGAPVATVNDQLAVSATTESMAAWVPPTLSSSSVFEMQLLGNGSCAWPAGTSSNITQIADATTVQCLEACLALDGCVAASVDGSTCELHTNSASGLYRAASGSAFCYEKEVHSTSLSSSSAEASSVAHSTGAVFVYSWGDGGWEYSERLVGHDTAAGDRFGDVISMDADRIVVGATGDDHQYADPNDDYNSAAPTRMPTSMPTGTPTSATSAPTASSSVLPYPCDWNTPPLQMIARNADKEFDIKILDIETGSYVQQYAVRSVEMGTSWDVGTINGASISPNDNKIYAMTWLEGSGGLDYIVRFDNATFEYVAQVYYSYAATFDRVNGDFFYAEQGSDHTRLYRYSNVYDLAGFTNQEDAVDWRGIDYVYDWATCTNGAGTVLDTSCDGGGSPLEKFADLAPLSADLEGTGSNQDYMIGMGKYNHLLVIKYTSTTYTHWLLDVTVSGSGTLTYGDQKGAGWNYQDSNGDDHLYFAQNDGAGVCEVLVSTVNLAARTVSVEMAGMSAPSAGNDGMNCFQATVPFPTCGDKNGPVSDPNPYPVTDDECGAGMMYNEANQLAGCVGSPCDVGSSAGLDQDQCCTAVPTSAPTPAGYVVPTIVANNSGSVYVFKRNAVTNKWVQEDKLSGKPYPVANSGFGSAVAVSGERLAVGLPTATTSRGALTGSVQVFTHNANATGNDTAWSFNYELVALDGQPGDQFGRFVSISSDGRVAASAPSANDGAGAVYIFYPVADGSNWFQESKLAASDSSAGSYFGYSPSMDAHKIAVGAPYTQHSTVNQVYGVTISVDTAAQAGAAYVFEREHTPVDDMSCSRDLPKLDISSTHFGVTNNVGGFVCGVSTRAIPLDDDTQTTDSQLWSGGVASGNKLFGIPKDSRSVLVMETNTSWTAAIQLDQFAAVHNDTACESGTNICRCPLPPAPSPAPTPAPTSAPTAAPTPQPTGAAEVDWGDPCTYTSSAHEVAFTVSQGQTELMTHLYPGYDKVYIRMSANADIDLVLTGSNGDVLIAYNFQGTSYKKHWCLSVTDCPPYYNIINFNRTLGNSSMTIGSCTDRCSHTMTVGPYYDGAYHTLTGDNSYEDEYIYIAKVTEELKLYVNGYAAGTGKVTFLYDCDQACGNCTALGDHSNRRQETVGAHTPMRSTAESGARRSSSTLSCTWIGSSTGNDEYCNSNCNAVPAYCPSSSCSCTTVSGAPSTSSPTGGPTTDPDEPSGRYPTESPSHSPTSTPITGTPTGMPTSMPTTTSPTGAPSASPTSQTQFILQPGAQSWDAARTECRQLGGELATIKDTADNAAAAALATSSAVWIGLNDQISEGSFQWAGGVTAGWHLAPSGTVACDSGKVATLQECEAAARWLASENGMTDSSQMVTSSGGSCLDGAAGNVPVGCSVHTSDWAAHYKAPGTFNCAGTDYQLVCSGIANSTAPSDYMYLFDGCCRGTSAASQTNQGSMSRANCEAACTADASCNAFEMNGFLTDSVNGGGACLHFSGAGAEIYNGACVTTGDQKCFQKPRHTLAVSWRTHESQAVSGGMLSYSGTAHGCSIANGQCYWAAATSASLAEAKSNCADWSECKALSCSTFNTDGASCAGGDQWCPAGYQSIDENLDGTGKEWSQPHPSASRTIEECEAVCDSRTGCTGFEFGSAGSGLGACGTYTGGDSNKQSDEQRTSAGSEWRSCMKLQCEASYLCFAASRPVLAAETGATSYELLMPASIEQAVYTTDCAGAAATAPDCIAASGCVFPFEYYGVEYSACTTIGEGGTGTSACWCSTTSTMVPDSSNWKYCSDGCNPAAVVSGDDMSTFDFSAANNVDASAVYDGDFTNVIDASNKQLIVAVRLSATCVSSSLAVYGYDADDSSTDLRGVRVAYSSDGLSWSCFTQSDGTPQAGLSLSTASTDCAQGSSHMPSGSVFRIPSAARYVQFAFWGNTRIKEVSLDSCQLAAGYSNWHFGEPDGDTAGSCPAACTNCANSPGCTQCCSSNSWCGAGSAWCDNGGVDCSGCSESNCVQLGQDGSWSDMPCGTELPYLCQLPENAQSIVQARALATTVLCWSTGDPHFNAFGGGRFDFQEVGEFKLLESTADQIKVHVFHCPWMARYVGAASNVGVAATVGTHSIEMIDSTITVDGTVLSDASTTFSDGVTVLITSTSFEIQGPQNFAGRANLKISRRSFSTSDMPTGYYYDMYARLPSPHTGAASGLCYSSSSGSTLMDSSSLFSSSTLTTLNQQCFVDSGVSMAGHVAITTAAAAAAATGITVASGEAACAGVDPSTFDGCVFDYCLTGLQEVVQYAAQAASDIQVEIDAITVEVEAAAQIAIDRSGWPHEGLWNCSTQESHRSFVSVPRHSHLQVKARFWAVGGWSVSGDTLDSGFLQVDGEELWRRTRASEFNCRPGFVEDSDHINGTASRESKCFRDIELNISHSAASFTLTIGASLSCANTDAFWGFSDVQVNAIHSPTGCYTWKDTAESPAADCWSLSEQSGADGQKAAAGWVSALDASSGDWQWITATGGDATLHEVTTADGLVYVSGQLARGTVVDFGTSQLAQDEAAGEWVQLLADYSYSGGASGVAASPLATGEFSMIKAVYKSGYVSCHSETTGCVVLDTTQVWQACRGNCEGYTNPTSFEMLLEGSYVLEQTDFGTLDPRCTAPAQNDPSGDIVCDVQLSIAPGNTVILSWYEPSHNIDISNKMGTIVVDLWGLRTDTSTSGQYDTFVAALDQHGAWQWATPAVHSGFYGRGAAVTAAGQLVFAAGRLQQSRLIGEIQLSSAGAGDAWVAAWNSNGQCQWAVTAGGLGEDAAHAIAASSDQLFVAGHFTGNATFGNMTLVSVGDFDVFVAALGLDGSWQWAVAGGGVQSDTIDSLVYSHGALFGGVQFQGRARFGSSTVTSVHSTDSAIVRLDVTGAWQWATTYSGVGADSNKVAGIALNWDRLFTVGTSIVTSSYVTVGNTTLPSGATLWQSSATMQSPVVVPRPTNFAAYPSELGLISTTVTSDELPAEEWDGTFN